MRTFDSLCVKHNFTLTENTYGRILSYHYMTLYQKGNWGGGGGAGFVFILFGFLICMFCTTKINNNKKHTKNNNRGIETHLVDPPPQWSMLAAQTQTVKHTHTRSKDELEGGKHQKEMANETQLYQTTQHRSAGVKSHVPGTGHTVSVRNKRHRPRALCRKEESGGKRSKTSNMFTRNQRY